MMQICIVCLTEVRSTSCYCFQIKSCCQLQAVLTGGPPAHCQQHPDYTDKPNNMKQKCAVLIRISLLSIEVIVSCGFRFSSNASCTCRKLDLTRASIHAQCLSYHCNFLNDFRHQEIAFVMGKPGCRSCKHKRFVLEGCCEFEQN
jgi:hypothetical protein